ncbi:AGE family epimerase/isomerase [Lewinella sp. W8]|uniref:AGE family epimerase/isomerase n=1 Tax=Lewinella sp. W8 TaxID=2528208 RepID=UPI001067E375|nr:AGE family epimerase/isomerase [Lewinella sp. W8]MTB52068.1 N-acyl-D-glucosamine 2-epimerase [Lewinella sp. W8]
MTIPQFKQCLDDILGWWMNTMIDREHGGFYGRVDGYGQLHPTADKGVILNTRILWGFAAAARATGREDYRQMADRAYRYLVDHFLDREHGGLYWMLDHRGRPKDGRKQVYAQAFGLYAFSEYYLLTRQAEHAEMVWAFFRLIEDHAYDEQYGGYLEAFTREWRLPEDFRLSPRDLNAAKSMNTHLHVMEAYTNCLRTNAHPAVRGALGQLIEVMLRRFVRPDSGHLHLFFDADWTLRAEIDSYGHDIECSWLLTEAAESFRVFAPALVERTEAVALLMARTSRERGIFPDGAFRTEAAEDLVDTDRHWWPQAEAIVGFYNAHQLTGDVDYRAAAESIWAYTRGHFILPEGEWHWRLNQDGTPNPTEDLAGPWKAPYHNVRMCLEMMRRLGE